MDATTRTVNVAIPGGTLPFEVLADDAIIGPAIAKGSWADDETALMCAHLGKGQRMVDLGGNVGWFAVQAILAGAEVDCFEPVPAIAAVAARNVAAANERGPGKGRVHEFAAGAERGEASIVLSTANHGDNRVVEGDTPADLGDAERLTIQIAPVDDFVKGPVRFLKVDTQGSEWAALQGCKQLLADSPELGLLLELWPYALRGATAEELLAFLDDEGFVLGKATNGPYPMTTARILAQVGNAADVKGGIDLYGTRRRPFHVLGTKARLRGMWRSLKET
ncbi:MAG: hypothetical protein DHS20C15_25950 [Planctomycetota bacterium]|nr:MAG: hypothetical protein DHS20C15_25950 [Planctomycetota bacterium]